jgi:hypothetical protein
MPRRRRWLLPASLVGGLFLAAGAAGTWVLMSEEEGKPRARLSALKIGSLPEMPDLRDGVPALMSSLSPKKPVASPADEARLAHALSAPPAPAPDTAEDANRKAMASTIASANLRPALAAPLAEQAATPLPPQVREAQAPGPTKTPAPAPPTATVVQAPEPAAPSALAAAPLPEAAPIRQVDIKQPAQTASIDGPRSVVAPATPPAPPRMPEPHADARQPESAAPDARTPKPAPEAAVSAPAEAAPALSETPVTRAASLPQEAPLPPPRPAMHSAEAPERTTPTPRQAAAERAATPRPRPVASAAPRPAPPQPAAAQAPAAAQEEERSLLGIPVPKFVPSGRDFRDAAATITDAVTSLPGF